MKKKKFSLRSKQDTTFVYDNGSTLCQLSPPINFFPKWMSHIFIRNYRGKWQKKKDNSTRKMIQHCHLLANYQKLLLGAANIYNLPIYKQCDFGPRVFFCLNRASTIFLKDTIVSACLYSVPYIFMQHIF